MFRYSGIFMRLMVALLVLGWANAVQAKWLEATSQNFIVYSDGDEKGLRKLTERLERFDIVLRIMTGINEPPSGMKLKVFLLSSERGVRDIYPGDNRRVAGFYTTSLHGPVAFVPRVKRDDIFDLDGEQVLFHEYAHHFMRKYTRAAYPAWYVEGFAEYFATVAFKEKEGEIHVGKPANPRVPSLHLESWVPLEKLMTLSYHGSVKPSDTEMRQLYAQGWLFTHYLFWNKARQGQISAYILNLNKGMAEKNAFEAAFKADHATLHKELRSYFNGGKLAYQILNTTVVKPVDIIVRALTPSEDAALLPGQKMRLFVQKDERDKLYKTVTTHLAPHLQTDAGRLAQAELELRFGETSKISPLLAPMLAQNPNEPTALMLEAILAMQLAQKAAPADRAAAFAKARKAAVKANVAATETPLPLLLYFQTFAMQSEAVPEVALNGLIKAWELLPQDTGLTFTLASALANKKRFDEAKFLLMPIVNSAHGGKAAALAQRMIDKITAGESSGGITMLSDEAEEKD